MTDARTMPIPPGASARDWRGLVAGVLVLLISVVVVVRGGVPFGTDEPDEPGRFLLLMLALVDQGSFALGWLAAAGGYGFVARRWLLGRDAFEGLWPLQLVMGGGVMMGLAWVGGWAGELNVGSGWALLITGWVLLIAQWWPRLSSQSAMSLPSVPWPLIAGLPAAVLLVIAATIAPGVLWHPTEMGGYDALSYHLQLPNEWREAGAIIGLEHNVYSYLTSGFEAVYFHMAILQGGAVDAAVTCQLLHAFMALLAGCVIAMLVRRLAESFDAPPHGAALAGAAAGAIYIAVPWVIVTGSLAYNEQAMAAFGAAALAVALWPDAMAPWRRGLASGLLCGCAVLCKLTALGMFALPLAIILINLRGRPRNGVALGLIALATFAAGVMGCVGIFMVRNYLWTGNPVFPLLTGIFGTAHWSAEQAIRWNAAHAPPADLSERFSRIVPMVLAHQQYGFLIWPAGIAAIIGGLCAARTRRVAAMLLIMLIVQFVFWLGATHVQSRFMVAALVPLVIAIGMGLAMIPATRVCLVVALVSVVVLTAIGYQLYLKQVNGMASKFIGKTAAVQMMLPPAAMLNHQPHGTVRVYSEGWATPLYLQHPVTYHTVWDTSPLGRLMDEHGVVGAIQALRDAGYTHIIIDRVMLSVWWEQGNYGYDPSITPQRISDVENLGLPVFDVDPRGLIVVYELSPAAGRN